MSAIGNRLSEVQQRITVAVAAAGLPPKAVRLLAVSKTFGPQAVCDAVAGGQRDFGENYVQEGISKRASVGIHLTEMALKSSAPNPTEALRWHFIGPLQSNKTKEVAAYFDWVHSVDRLKIAERLAHQRPAGLLPLEICLQVNLDDEATKSGVPPNSVNPMLEALAQLASETGALRLRGLMAIPAPRNTFDEQRAAFRQLRELLLVNKARLEAAYPEKVVRLNTLSMGMSADLEAAIAESDSQLVTWVRIGTAIFGQRVRP
ncbi:MAG: hypothetical protein RLZZ344_237 [Pseudomonadota bacterium]|jgi:pyridoxal phosphate enzyme (YggS family)